LDGKGLNVMPSNSSSGSGKSEGGNGTMDVGEGIVVLLYLAALLV